MGKQHSGCCKAKKIKFCPEKENSHLYSATFFQVPLVHKTRVQFEANKWKIEQTIDPDTPFLGGRKRKRVTYWTREAIVSVRLAKSNLRFKDRRRFWREIREQLVNEAQ